jgi:hypothetical protein
MPVGARGRSTNCRLTLSEGATAPVSDADEVAFRYNTALARPEYSTNAGPYVPFAAGMGQLVFANIAAMGAYADGLLDDGAECIVATLMADWKLVRSSVAVPDGITIVAASSGVGNWHRAQSNNSYWDSIPDWWISDGIGNDEADGATALTPIATWNEFWRRRGPRLNTDGVVSVTLDGAGGVFTQDLDIDMPFKRGPDAGNRALWLRGTRTLLYSGTVSARTVWNAVAGTVTTITDAGLPASWTASGLVGMLLVMTSGPNVGYATFVGKDLGGKRMRCAQLFSDALQIGGVEPSVGETFEVYSLTEVTGAVNFSTATARVWLTDLYFNPGLINGDFGSAGATIYVGNCRMETSHIEIHGAFIEWFGSLLNGPGGSDFHGGRYGLAWTYVLDAALVYHTGGELTLRENTVLDVSQLGANYGGGAVSLGPGELAIFDAAGMPPIRVFTGGVVYVDAALFGSGNLSDHIVTVQSGGIITWDPAILPTVTGAIVADVSVGGVDRTWAQAVAGYVNLTNLASSVVAAE